MNHSDLLDKFTDYEAHFDQVQDEPKVFAMLRAVVEFHSPCKGDDHDDSLEDPCICKGCFDEEWPCPTIQAIEKELGINA